MNAQEKTIKYESLLPQIQSVIANESDLIANMANISSMLQYEFNFFWTGFYRVIGDCLVLAPFQGPLACTRIKKGKGVCGTSWERKETIVVPNVEEFEGHIACSSQSKSEIVVPIIKDNEVIAVLDIDSECLNTFNEVDKHYLEQVSNMLSLRI